MPLSLAGIEEAFFVGDTTTGFFLCVENKCVKLSHLFLNAMMSLLACFSGTGLLVKNPGCFCKSFKACTWASRLSGSTFRVIVYSRAPFISRAKLIPRLKLPMGIWR